jgi:hypothetical protein
MDDKARLILRGETVINRPEQFRVRRRVRRRGRRKAECGPLRKSVAYLSRSREICRPCNSRDLAALALVEDPLPALRGLDDITVGKVPAPGRSVKTFNPIARADSHLLRRPPERRPQPARLRQSRSPRQAQAPLVSPQRSRRWRVSIFGYRSMSASLQLRQTFTGLHAKAAA